MIKVDKEKISLNGKAIDIITELTYALVYICKRISEETDEDIEKVFAEVGAGVMTSSVVAIKAYKDEK